MSAAEESLDLLTQTLGYAFSDPELLELALAHRSYAYEVEDGRDNERLEFLGDAVLDLVISDVLYQVHPEWDEGDLTRTRAALVNQESLSNRARQLDLGRFIRLGRTEMCSGGEDKDSILANCFEALVGAIYLDGGLPAVVDFVRRVFGTSLESSAVRQPRDAKTEFQEWVHARYQRTPSYRMVSDTGTEDDSRRFRVEVAIGDEVWGLGVGRSKRLAERGAAEAALVRGRPSDGNGDG